MPGGLMSVFLRLLRSGGRRRRLTGRRRRRIGGLPHHHFHSRYARRFVGRRHGAGTHRGFRVLRRHHRNGAGPSNQPMPPPAPAPPQPDVPAWPPAGPAAPRLEADENIDPALAAPPPPFWCSVHRWIVCPLHQYDFVVADLVVAAPQEEGTVVVDDEEDGSAPLQHPTQVVVGADGGAPLPTLPMVAHVPAAHQVQVRDGDSLAFVSAPTGATVFNFGSGANGSSNHAVVDVDAIAPRLLTPTPATPPPSPATGARRRLIALGVPLASSPSSSRSGRSGTWGPAALMLANGLAPSTLLPGDSSDEDKRGGSAPRRQ